MRLLLTSLVALLVAAIFVSPASATAPNYPCPECIRYAAPAPDACGQGWYNTNCYGAVYGPHYNVTPPFMPWQGALPAPQRNNCCGSYPSHPYARSPRDYFMLEDMGRGER